MSTAYGSWCWVLDVGDGDADRIRRMTEQNRNQAHTRCDGNVTVYAQDNNNNNMTQQPRQRRILLIACLLLWGVSPTAAAKDDNAFSPSSSKGTESATRTRNDAILPPRYYYLRNLQFDSEKINPNKGDVAACTKIEDLWEQHLQGNYNGTQLPPCRNVTDENAINQGGNGNGMESPNIRPDPEFPGESSIVAENASSDEDLDLTIADDVIGRDNRVTIFALAALRPGTSNSRFVVTKVVTSVLNETENDFNFFLAHRRGRELQQMPTATGGATAAAATYNMVYQRTTVVNLRQLPDRWWWRYDMDYGCFWRPSGRPVRNQTLLGIIAANLTESLQRVIDSGMIQKRIADEMQDDSVLEVSLVGEDEADGVGGIIGRDDPTFPNPLDPQGWDYSRWLGLGLFCGTFVMTLLLTQLASYRKRRRRAKEAWGNLGPESGVDELLKTGWNIKGSNMEIYDKGKLGYQENDSMLMGGFEQKHHAIGTEVTVTQSTKSPDSGNRS